MPGVRSKKTDTVVVRPIHQGADTPRKMVLAPLKALNPHQPLVSPPPHAPHPSTRPLPAIPFPLPPLILPPLPHMPLLSLPTPGLLADAGVDPDHGIQKVLAPELVAPPAKPWKQPKTVPRIYRQMHSPPGQVYRPATGPEYDQARGAYEVDVQEEWEREWAEESQHNAEEDTRGRVEVHILDIAKPAKPRGPAKEYEVVQTVRRVIALEDDDAWEEWEIGSEDEFEVDEWEAIEDEKHRHASYAMVLQQSPG
uniref:G protein beta subunit Gib2 n=1 Tax=Ganoderma boninense TaxID=34458 RepID=A0A5K1K642_9APHY|nr:G protein beta subunit Gib2 [Ganoderma boninense]